MRSAASTSWPSPPQHGGEFDGDCQACIALVRTSEDPSSETGWLECLHPRERQRYHGFRMPQRRATFLLGRYAAKSALSGLRPGLHPDEVEVSPGSFAQPVVRGVPNCNVSLSHSGGTAVAIAFGSEILMGIDLELRSEARVRRVQRLLKLDREMPLGSEALPSDVLPLALWTAIEALSKALRCGLTVPLEVFAVSRVDRLRCSFAEKTVGSAHLQFREFGAFEAQTWWSNHEVISVVYPRHIRHEFSLPSALRLHGQGLGVSFVRYSI